MFFFCFFSKNSRERRKITMPSRRWIDCDWGKVRNTWGQCRRMYIVLIAQTCFRCSAPVCVTTAGFDVSVRRIVSFQGKWSFSEANVGGLPGKFVFHDPCSPSLHLGNQPLRPLSLRKARATEVLLTDTIKSQIAKPYQYTQHSARRNDSGAKRRREKYQTKRLGRKLSTESSSNSKVISFHISNHIFIAEKAKHFGIAISRDGLHVLLTQICSLARFVS